MTGPGRVADQRAGDHEGAPSMQDGVAASARTRPAVHRPIVALDLARFQRPRIPGQPSLPVRALWYGVNATLFEGRLLGLLPGSLKARILRLFGARVGHGLVVKPAVSIKSPWHLVIGDHVWIGERSWIDNHTTVRIGSNVCISQGCYVFTGNHDWTDPAFAFFCKPVTIGDGVWLTAFQRLGPGSDVPAHVAIL